MQLLYAWWRTIQQTFIKKFCQNTCSETAIKTYFHFSCYKSMETIISCHSNESTWATAIENVHSVEANVMNISAKFQLHPPCGFWGDDLWIFVYEFILSVALATNQIQRFGQNSYIWQRTTRGTFLQNFCQNIWCEIAIKTCFHFSHYKSMETSSCHSNESTWAMGIKSIPYVEPNVMNISVKFQLHSPYGFWGDDFLIFFLQM